MKNEEESFPTQAELEKIITEAFQKGEEKIKSKGIIPRDVSNKTLIEYIQGFVQIQVSNHYQNQILIQQNREILEELKRHNENKQAEQYLTGNKY